MARIPSVKGLETVISLEIRDKYFNKFSKQARYLGNGVYSIPGTNLIANDTRALFLMFCAAQEGIEFKNN
jgi:hypothetical protein